MSRKKSEHYVNNKEFLEALIVYRAEVAVAQEKGLIPLRKTFSLNFIHENCPDN
jgi:hypothetical protein